MKKRNLVLVILAILLVLGMVSCGDLPEDEPGEATFVSVSANGSGLETTTQLTLTFDKAVPNFTVTLGSGATKGSLSGSGPTYTLAVSGITADATVNVTVSKSNWTITGAQKTVAVKYSAAGKAAAYFGKDFRATYKLSSGNAIEKLEFLAKDSLKISEVSPSSGEYISYTINKWDDVTTIPDWEDVQYPSDDFNIGFKLTGYFTAANPKVDTGDNACLYGTKTAKGFVTSDIDNKTPATIYIYILDDDPDLIIARSVFSKDADKDSADAKKPVDGSDNDKRIRFYSEANE